MPLRDHFRRAINVSLSSSSNRRRYAVEALDFYQTGTPTIYSNVDGGTQIELPFSDVFCQTARPDLLTFEDLVYVAESWQKILSGEMIYRILVVGESPHGDKETTANRAILKDMLSHYQERDVGILNADFQGGGHDEDGYVSFSKPFITKDSENGTAGSCKRFPLEVGYCMPDQMSFHLRQSRCVARFPYNHELIIFLEDTSRGGVL